jgi:hypothetical protein
MFKSTLSVQIKPSTKIMIDDSLAKLNKPVQLSEIERRRLEKLKQKAQVKNKN